MLIMRSYLGIQYTDIVDEIICSANDSMPWYTDIIVYSDIREYNIAYIPILAEILVLLDPAGSLHYCVLAARLSQPVSSAIKGCPLLSAGFHSYSNCR
jgi:hypothetical protein